MEHRINKVLNSIPQSGTPKYDSRSCELAETPILDDHFMSCQYIHEVSLGSQKVDERDQELEMSPVLRTWRESQPCSSLTCLERENSDNSLDDMNVAEYMRIHNQKHKFIDDAKEAQATSSPRSPRSKRPRVLQPSYYEIEHSSHHHSISIPQEMLLRQDDCLGWTTTTRDSSFIDAIFDPEPEVLSPEITTNIINSTSSSIKCSTLSQLSSFTQSASLSGKHIQAQIDAICDLDRDILFA